MNICDKYYWITAHPAYVPMGAEACIEVTPHMVCPETRRIENLNFLNTKLEFWVELMTPFFDEETKIWTLAHDWELDCGGDSWEEAIEALYQKVLKHHGDYDINEVHEARSEHNGEYDLLKLIREEQAVPVGDADYEYAKPVMFTSEELVFLMAEIRDKEAYQDLLVSKREDASFTPEQIQAIDNELQRIEHDLKISRASLDVGYDVDRYGFPE